MTCDHNLTTSFGPSSTVNPKVKKKIFLQDSGFQDFAISISDFTRFVPNDIVAQTIDNSDIVRTELPFENTRHRYPWLCSLRSKGSRSKHLCGVTLLRYFIFKLSRLIDKSKKGLYLKL